MSREKNYIEISNRGEYQLELLKGYIECARKEKWNKKDWFPRKALIDKVGGSSRLYVSQEFNPKHIDLVNKGWTHDHCEICNLTLCEDSTSACYFDGNDWICDQCYDLFIISLDSNKALDKLLIK